MEDLFAPCGINCGRCPSYKSNLLTNEDRQRCSDGWYKYHGFRLSPEKLLRCDGCPMPTEENPVRYFKHGCNVRKCAVFNGVETCAHCSKYPCEDLKGLASIVNREEMESRLGIPIPEEDYLAFVEPYEGLKHLDEIRASLAPEDIVEMTEVSARPRIANFPDSLPFSTEQTTALEALHRLLATVGSADGISHARQRVLKKQRQHLLKILWAFGRFGELREEGGPHLTIDSETYLAQKIHSSYSRVKDYFKILGEYGAHCEHLPLVEEGWLTPTGALRKGGWFMKLSFGDDAGGTEALHALQSYTARLHEEYGKRAFGYFSRADMRILSQ